MKDFVAVVVVLVSFFALLLSLLFFTHTKLRQIGSMSVSGHTFLVQLPKSVDLS